MPSGSMPLYKFRPTIEKVATERSFKIRTFNLRRARLWEGGTYFRAKDPGQHGNLISIQLVADDPLSSSSLSPGGYAYLIVTNYNSAYDETVIGEASVKMMNTRMKWNDLVIVDNLQDTPNAKKYSISLRIAFERQSGSSEVPTVVDSETPFAFGKVFKQGELSIQLEKTDHIYTSNDVVSIVPRIKIYRLSKSLITPATNTTGGTTPQPYYGYLPSDLRTQMANDPWVEMLERSGPTTDATGVSTPNPNPADVQDPTIDADALTLFGETFLKGGDGLPSTPGAERTGPVRALAYVNYGEAKNGVLTNHNTIYEWKGSNATSGSWSAY